MVNDLVTRKKIVNLVQKPSVAAKSILNRYRFPEEIAMLSIKLAFRTLKQLNVI